MLTAIARAQARLPRPDARHRIDHFYFPTREQIVQGARLQVWAGVQPAFALAFEEMYKARLGDRVARVHPYRWFLDAGVVAGGGSDSFVAPIDPIRGIHAAVNHFVPAQRISVMEALRMFTVNDAYLGFEEAECGALRVGMRGDVVVLSDDLLRVDPHRISTMQVEVTVCRGRLVYQAGAGVARA